MGIESEGRKAYLIITEMFRGEGTSESLDLGLMPGEEGIEGAFLTLPQIAEIEASHAQALVAARGEGAAAMHHEAMMLASRFINGATPAKDDFQAGTLSAYQNVRDGLKLTTTPDTTYTDTVRKEERGKVLEEAAASRNLFELICTELCFHSEGEQCKFAPCAECKNEERFAYYEPQGLAIMDCIRSLAQDKE